MTYEDTLRHIYSLGRFGIKPGLERITALLHAVGDPHDRVTTIHVAGTNGKGSTAAFLAAILAAAGLKVGLYTSPHLVAFTERIRVNGGEIPPEEVVPLAARVLQAAPAGATFFEIVTAMALLHFASEKVDLAVMEVGMGGRFDATNAASGVLSIITPVGLDHTDYLGTTIAAIASEKGGIIRKGRPVVVSPQPFAARAVIEERARELAAPLYLQGRNFSAAWNNDLLDYEGIGVRLGGMRPGIGGRYQAANAASALAAAELLGVGGFKIPLPALAAGIDAARWPGRMEMLGVSPRFLLDGAHNPAAAAALVESLAAVPRRRLLVVLGLMADKDLGGVLRPLLPLAAEVLAVSPLVPRALPSAELAVWCRSEGAECTDAGGVAGGLALARERAGEGDLVLVTGSLFTVGEARALLLGRQFEPFRG